MSGSRVTSLVVLVAALAVARTAAADDKRPLPDYDGRGGEPKTAGDALLWAPRVALSPLYLVSEFVLRRPLGAIIAGAERAGLPATLYDFFAFGPDHKFGIVPTVFVDFGFRPSVGLYAFWDDAVVRGNDLRLHLGTWGADWLSASLSDRVHLSKDKYDRVAFDASASRRPDYAYFGIGPSTRETDLTRYGSDRLELKAGLDERLWRTSSFHASVAARSVEFHHGELGRDASLDAVVASGLTPPPPGFPRGYTAVVSTLSAALDSRRTRPASSSGVRLEIEGAHGSDVRQNGSWVKYGGSAGAFVDLNDHARVLSLSVSAHFADPLGHEAIPFTELVHLGGVGQMRAFYPGRLVDRSATVAELAYRWPIWIWLDGSIRMEVGNVFGEHLQDFKPLFRPLAKVFAVDPPREAPNVNALDEVPDSAWFTNRIGRNKPSIAELVRGACTPEEILDADGAVPSTWVIDQGKANGASAGFRIKIAGRRKYMMKTDVKEQPERPSAASAIGAAVYHAVGFNTSCEQVVFVDPRSLQLSPGLVVTDNSGIPRPFDQKALAAVLDGATHRGERVRLQASAWLSGYLIGPFRYEKTRGDDPNDAIDHEDRRDLRGARVLAAWLDHFDAREQNSMDAWIAEDQKTIDSSPGHVRHYYLDTSDCFGSEWAWDGISRRLGRSYLLDWGDIAADFVTLGIPTRPWDRAERTKGMEMFGYFPSPEFDPEGWKNEYPNPAFGRATERDNAWMARILSRFDRDDIRALVDLGKFGDPRQSDFLTGVLEWRLARIAERFLLRLSPVADVRVTAPNTVCATDLARRRHVRPETSFRYSARWRNQGHSQDVAIVPTADGEICLTLPSANVDAAVADDAPSRYSVVAIANGASTYPLRAHFYDLGAKADIVSWAWSATRTQTNHEPYVPARA